MITIKDIAREVGVSYSTVSRALNHVPGTKEETRRRVLEVAERLGYEPNAIARSLVTNRSHTLAFILPDLANPFFTTILQSAEREADAQGYQLLITETRWDEEKEQQELKLLKEKRVDGILLYPARMGEGAPLDLGQTPLVIFGPYPSDIKGRCRSVEVDNARGCRLGLEHLYAGGYRRLAFLGGPDHSASNEVRAQSYQAFVEKNGLPQRAQWIQSGSFTVESGYERAKRLLQETGERRPDALVCANDMIALGALQALSEASVAVPTEMGVLGFDDVKYAALPQIQLSTVHIPCEEMGSLGTRLLLNELAREQGDSDPMLLASSHLLLEPRLVVRKTTRPATP